MTKASLLSHRLTDRQLRLTFGPEAVEEVREIVSLERSCCEFLEFDVQVNVSDVALTITAPADTGAAAA